MSVQNDRESVKDLLQRGLITLDQANVMLVLDERVRLVTSKVPASVRAALMAAVKSGELGRKKKDGHKPECFYNPSFEYLANHARNKHERNVFEALKRVAGYPQG